MPLFEKFDWLSKQKFADVAITGTVSLDSGAFGKMHAISGTSADYTITLPAVSGNTGQIIGFRVAASGSASKIYTIDGNSSETIDGAANKVLWAQESLVILCTGSEWVTLAEYRIPMKCSMYRNTAQSIGTPAHIQVQLDTTNFDVGSLADTTNNQITIRRAGKYQVMASAESPAVLDDGEFGLLGVHLNTFGTPVWDDFRYSAGANLNVKLSFSTILDLAAGDDLMLGLRHNEGAAWNTLTGTNQRPTLIALELL
jgi:hypothetical protein